MKPNGRAKEAKGPNGKPSVENGKGSSASGANREARELQRRWASDSRWSGVMRPYSAEDVLRLRGSVRIEHTLARLGAERLWQCMTTYPYLNALGAMSGNQAVQQVA
ncbi:MAG: hypothetical protein ACRD5G_12600, partial [Candidatus Acidiferrales bacterium]